MTILAWIGVAAVVAVVALFASPSMRRYSKMKKM